MTKTRRTTRLIDAQPLWLRRVAALCVLLTAFIGTAQAVHTHGEWLPRAAHSLHAPSVSPEGTGEEHCPLCVALHSVLPATSFGVPLPVEASVSIITLRPLHRPAAAPHFALFSRPPPNC